MMTGASPFASSQQLAPGTVLAHFAPPREYRFGAIPDASRARLERPGGRTPHRTAALTALVVARDPQ